MTNYEILQEAAKVRGEVELNFLQDKARLKASYNEALEQLVAEHNEKLKNVVDK